VLALLLIVGVAGFGLLLVRYGPPGFDESLLLSFRRTDDSGRVAGPQWLTTFWLGVTSLGGARSRIVMVALLLTGLCLLRRRSGALFSAAILSSGFVLSTAIKYFVGRPRPHLVAHLVHAGSPGFPSGHALNSTLFYMTLALLLAPLLHSRGGRWVLYGVTAGLSLATGVSRIALGVHYPTDVIAGWVIAAAWLWFCFTVAGRYWPRALRDRGISEITERMLLNRN